MPSKTGPILNWFEKDQKPTEGLREMVANAGNGLQLFTTIRLGVRWANRLRPGSIVAISISNDPAKPKIIGQAKVGVVKKSKIDFLSDEDEDLGHNIGAKSRYQVLRDMKEVYGEDKVGPGSVISIIELIV